MRTYKCLYIDQALEDNFSLVPIRDEDKYEILNWRNAQIDILRQQAPLTKDQQENYFKTTIAQLFEQENPKQILFSFLENGKLIGYGGLVHIDWENKKAEISFLTETSRNTSKEQFISDWVRFLSILKKITLEHLHFNAIYTFAYDVRPNLYIALEKAGFKETKRISQHIKINNELKDAVIHTFYFSNLKMRAADANDVDLYYKWSNDPLVRQNSYNNKAIDHQEHITWFTDKLRSPDCFFYLFLNEKNDPCGQVRIDRSKEEIIIGISIDEKYRGHGLGVQMLNLACSDYLKKFPKREIISYIKEDNTASLKQFLKADFTQIEKVMVNNINSYKLKRSIT